MYADRVDQALEGIEPLKFQVVALDAFRAHHAGRGLLVSYNLRHGARDGGWDGQYDGETELADGSSRRGRFRVEVKATRDFQALRREVRQLIHNHGDEPVIFLSNAALTEEQRSELLRLGPGVQVHARSPIASWIREHRWVWPDLRDPVLVFPDRLDLDDAGPPFDEEREAAAAATEAARRGSDVIVTCPPEINSRMVARLLAEVWQRAGQEQTPVVVQHWDQQTPQLQPERWLPLLLVRGDERALIAGIERLPSCVILGSVTSIRRLKHELGAIGREPQVIEARRPSPASRRRWLDHLSPGLPAHERDAQVLALGHRELMLRAARHGGRAAVNWLALALDDGASPSTLQVAAWDMLLRAAGHRQVGAPHLALGIDLTRWEAAQARLAEEGLSEPSGPFGDERPSLIVIAAILDGWLQDAPGRIARLEVIEQGAVLHHLLLLARARSDDDCGWTAEVHDLITRVARGWSQDARRAVLEQHAWPLCLQEDLFLDCLRMLHEADPDSWWWWDRAQEIAQAAPRYPLQIERVVDLLSVGRTGDLTSAREFVETLLNPDERSGAPRVRPEQATLVMTHARCMLAEGDRAMTVLLEVAVEQWLSAAIEHRRSTAANISWGLVPWNAHHPHLPEAFAAAAELLSTGLSSPDPQVRIAAWPLVGRMLDRSVVPKGDLPKALVESCDRVVGVALQRLAAMEVWEERHLAESAIVRLLGRSALSERHGSILDGLCRDPRYVAWRLLRDPGEVLVEEGPVRTAIARGREDAAEPDRAGVSEAWRAFARGLWHLQPRDRQDRHAQDLAHQLHASGASSQDLLHIVERAPADSPARSYGPARADLLAAWARLAPDVFEPLLFGAAWERLSPHARYHLILGAAPVFGERLLRQVPEADLTRGVDLDLIRLLTRPGQVPEELAVDLIYLLERIAPPRDALGLMADLTAHPAEAVHRALSRWLFRRAGADPEPDPRDVAWVFGQILAAWPLVAWEIWELSVDQGRSVWSAVDVEGLIDSVTRWIDAQRATLAVTPSSRSSTSALSRFPRLCDLVQRQRPAAWWSLLVACRGRPPTDDRLVLDPDASVAALRHGPAWPEVGTAEARTIDLLAGALPVERLAHEVRQLLHSGDVHRAATWLTSQPMQPGLLDATVDVLRRLPTQDAERLVHLIATDFGNDGWWTSGAIMTPRPLLSDHTPPVPDETEVERQWRERALQEPAAVRRYLLEMATVHARTRRERVGYGAAARG